MKSLVTISKITLWFVRLVTRIRQQQQQQQSVWVYAIMSVDFSFFSIFQECRCLELRKLLCSGHDCSLLFVSLLSSQIGWCVWPWHGVDLGRRCRDEKLSTRNPWNDSRWRVFSCHVSCIRSSIISTLSISAFCLSSSRVSR